MKIYRVGGSVRDELLGLVVKDRDYVVVGASPEQMAALGYQPVGKDFPVFLHPDSREEYALARTERKSGRGYKGFTVHASADVTLEDDLARRDLTINAMARDDDGRLIDPFGGERDLAARLLRHVSPAFVEDPVRILRVARFAARFRFGIAEETMALMRHMVEVGEADHLVPERIWQELSRGLMEDHPSIMFEVLVECGALARIAPDLDVVVDPGRDTGRASLAALDRAARQHAPLAVRLAVVAHRVGEGVDGLCERLRMPTECRELALLAARHLGYVRAAGSADPTALVDLFQRTDAFRRRGRFDALVHVAAIEDGATPGTWPPARRLRYALDIASGIDAGEIARRTHVKANIADRVRAARIEALTQAALPP
ncbi:MAG: multifunctional CCA tRNA nucleotidyl transferase/2'3'-cyclic phosphodiesterase/2'nucleotidase/phosphatase [Betaproteobacteria bacterium]|nr:multifunctional CCA tRNA nucleotidyl transferase/2'3'-cyclic phosphodiesterase/2'nucleotidase/phosphatase [Betaproteobacteria bacterium]